MLGFFFRCSGKVLVSILWLLWVITWHIKVCDIEHILHLKSFLRVPSHLQNLQGERARRLSLNIVVFNLSQKFWLVWQWAAVFLLRVIFHFFCTFLFHWNGMDIYDLLWLLLYPDRITEILLNVFSRHLKLWGKFLFLLARYMLGSCFLFAIVFFLFFNFLQLTFLIGYFILHQIVPYNRWNLSRTVLVDFNFICLHHLHLISMLNLFRPHFLHLIFNLNILLIHYGLLLRYLALYLSILRLTPGLIGLVSAWRKILQVAHRYTWIRGWLARFGLHQGILGVLLHSCCCCCTLGWGIHSHWRPPRFRLLLLGHQPLQLRVIRMLLLQERYSSFLFSLVYDIVNHTVIWERFGFPFWTPILALASLRFDRARVLMLQFMRTVWKWSILGVGDGRCAVFWWLDGGRCKKFEFARGAFFWLHLGFTSVPLRTFFRFCSGWAWRPLPRVHIIYLTIYKYK